MISVRHPLIESRPPATFCDVCNKIAFGVLYKCKSCNLVIHKSCKDLIRFNCQNNQQNVSAKFCDILTFRQQGKPKYHEITSRRKVRYNQKNFFKFSAGKQTWKIQQNSQKLFCDATAKGLQLHRLHTSWIGTHEAYHSSWRQRAPASEISSEKHSQSNLSNKPNLCQSSGKSASSEGTLPWFQTWSQNRF